MHRKRTGADDGTLLATLKGPDIAQSECASADSHDAVHYATPGCSFVSSAALAISFRCDCVANCADSSRVNLITRISNWLFSPHSNSTLTQAWSLLSPRSPRPEQTD